MSDEKTTIKTIADAFGISNSHLMKVVNALANKGWVASIRGKNGGIKLSANVSDINLKDVVVYMENNLDPINCESPMCRIVGVCELKPILINAQKEYMSYLARYTLADLIHKDTAISLSLA